ncbi:MAG: 30S ribosome-binding factor RbfA [Clostridia bacterium]|nr:30S ribosome-binding factor RbfA [Clostridia bacterium]
MSYNRIDRISEEVRREVDRIIREELSDPRVSGTFSVTRAEVTRDLRHAKIYVSVLEDDKREGMMKALKSAAGYVRRALGQNIIIRYSPELTFVSDENIAYGVHIAKVLADAQKTEGVTNEENESETP